MEDMLQIVVFIVMHCALKLKSAGGNENQQMCKAIVPKKKIYIYKNIYIIVDIYTVMAKNVCTLGKYNQ